MRIAHGTKLYAQSNFIMDLHGDIVQKPIEICFRGSDVLPIEFRFRGSDVLGLGFKKCAVRKSEVRQSRVRYYNVWNNMVLQGTARCKVLEATVR